MTHANGDMYQGEWEKGKAQGYGVFADVRGSLYEGQWHNDVQNGVGTEHWDYNAIKYTGDFKDGMKTGRGKFEFEGSSYIGDF